MLLYVTSGDRSKADKAETLLEQGGIVSVQVLNEVADVALRKFRMSLEHVRQTLDVIRSTCAVRPLDISTHEHGLRVRCHYEYRLYDCMIIASAMEAGCTTLYSEDMQHGQRIGKLTIRNPFRK